MLLRISISPPSTRCKFCTIYLQSNPYKIDFLELSQTVLSICTEDGGG